MIHEFDPHMAPDSDFEPGELKHLAPCVLGRMLDRRRTPVRVVALRPAIGVWVCEVMAFEDQGARWELPFESVRHYQFARGARLDLASRDGNAPLQHDLEALMRAHGLWELEQRFTQTFVSHPGSGEIVKGHALEIAALGLADFHGRVVRDPTLFDPPWAHEARAEHVITRLAFVREAFAAADIAAPVLYRALSSEQPLSARRRETFISTTFSREVAMSFFGATGDGVGAERHAALHRQSVPVERIFMTYLETAAMNRQFKEAEAVLFEDPKNLAI